MAKFTRHVAPVHLCSRPLVFARQIASHRNQPVGAQALGFIESYLGRKFAVDAAPGSASNMIYKKLGEHIYESFSTWHMHFFVSLRVSQVAQGFYSSLNKSLSVLFSSFNEQSRFLRAYPETQYKQFSHINPPTRIDQKELPGLLTTIEKIPHVFFNKAIAHETKTITLSTNTTRTSSLYTDFRWFSLSSGVSVATSPRAAQKPVTISHILPVQQFSPPPSGQFTLRLPATQFWQRDRGVDREGGDRQGRVRVPGVAPNFSGTASGGWYGYSGRALAPDGFTAGALTSFTLLPQTLLVAGGTAAARPGGVIRGYFGVGAAGFQSIPVMAVGVIPAWRMTLVAQLGQAFAAADKDHAENLTRAHAFLHQETPWQPPQLSYVFAQPLRPIAEAHYVINRVEEQEVVDIVKQEVQAAMSSGAATLHFTRTDYVHIADHVYATLVRRLLVEKERRGWRA